MLIYKNINAKSQTCIMLLLLCMKAGDEMYTTSYMLIRFTLLSCRNAVNWGGGWNSYCLCMCGRYCHCCGWPHTQLYRGKTSSASRVCAYVHAIGYHYTV